MEATENISYMEIPGSFPEGDSEIDASAPDTPCRTGSGPRNRRKPKTPPRRVSSQKNSTLVGPSEQDSPGTPCSHSPWDTPEKKDGNTSSARTTPTSARQWHPTFREGSPSPTTTRRSKFGAGSPGAHGILTAGASSSESTVQAPLGSPVETPRYKPHPNRRTVDEMLNRGLMKSDLSDGRIYVYRTREFPGLLKVGYTRNTAKKRLSRWKSQCKHIPILLRVYPKNRGSIPCPFLVESLIKAELAYCRKQLPRCPSCTARHGEWFEIGLPKLEPVAERWSEWARTLRDGPQTLAWPSHPRPNSALAIARKTGGAAPGASGNHPDLKITDFFHQAPTAPAWKREPQQSKPPSRGGDTVAIAVAATNEGLAITRGGLLDWVWHVFKKVVPVYLVISLILSFYPHQDCLALRLVLVFMCICILYSQSLI